MHTGGIAIAAVALAIASLATAQAPDPPDPSGVWRSPIGELSLLLAGDALSFSYSAVFGQSAHICDGSGVAGLVASSRYEYTDEQGTVAFLAGADGVRMEMSNGIASFCGAGWPGDTLVRDGSGARQICRVLLERSYFHIVGTSPPRRRKGFVIRGDRVEVIPLQHQGDEGWVLGRFRGPRGATVGLLRQVDLDCPDAPPPTP